MRFGICPADGARLRGAGHRAHPRKRLPQTRKHHEIGVLPDAIDLIADPNRLRQLDLVVLEER